MKSWLVGQKKWLPHRPRLLAAEVVGRQRLIRDGVRPLLVLFGTGWGLTEEVIGRADHLLPAITGIGTYNHLSVRTAAGIILDRVCGARDEAEEART